MKFLFQRQVHDLDELQRLAVDLWQLRSPKTIWLLEGEVGAGKTEFVKSLARSLRIPEVASPSFAIHHRYEVGPHFAIDHLDLYRLENEDDLESTGFWDLLSQDEGLIIIEWADKIEASFFPRDWVLYRLEFSATREIRVSTQAAL